jgi:hypothetical protein
MFLELANTTEKKIVGAKFDVQYVDSVGDVHESVFHYTSTDTVKPNKKHRYSWLAEHWDVQDSNGGTIAWIHKLLFDDGSTWEDHGVRTCMGMDGILEKKLKEGKIKLPDVAVSSTTSVE